MRNTTLKMNILLHGTYRLNIPEENINDLEFKMKHDEQKQD